MSGRKSAPAPRQVGADWFCPHDHDGGVRLAFEDVRHDRPAQGREPAVTAIWYRCADGHYSLRKVVR